MPTPESIAKVEQDFLRIVFLVGHVVKKDGVELGHQAGKYYHLAKAEAEDLIARGIARLDTVHEQLLEDEVRERAKASEKTATPEAAATAEGKGEPSVSPAPGVAEAGEEK